MTEHQNPAAYITKKPKATASPFVFAVPHSGRHYPADFIERARLDETALRLSEDAFVDQLFEDVLTHGAQLLIATYARAYLDLNRADNELDPALFLPRLQEQGLEQSHRVKAGLGLIPGIVSEGVRIYDNPLPAREAEKRRDLVHKPYHQKLADLLSDCKARYGKAYLIDCHSMPSEGGRKKRRGPDIVLGDSWGNSCSREFTSLAEELLLNEGFSVRRNVPYSGGYSTVHYGNPSAGIEALQIEINRAIYMDEETISPLPDFEIVAQKLKNASAKLMQRTQAQNQRNLPNAAE